MQIKMLIVIGLLSRICLIYSRYLHCYRVGHIMNAVDTCTGIQKDLRSIQQIPPLLCSRICSAYSRYLHCYTVEYIQHIVDTSTALQQDMCSLHRYIHCYSIGYVQYTIDPSTTVQQDMYSIQQIPLLLFSRICTVYNRSLH